MRINSFSPMQRTDFVNTNRGPGGFYSTTNKKRSVFGHQFIETDMTQAPLIKKYPEIDGSPKRGF
jgi:hypothetical protein